MINALDALCLVHDTQLEKDFDVNTQVDGEKLQPQMY